MPYISQEDTTKLTVTGESSRVGEGSAQSPTPVQGVALHRRGVGDRLSHAAACPGNMQTVYEAAGGADGLLRLANAWHARVMPGEVVSHGFHPEHSQRLATYWAESLGGPTTYSAPSVNAAATIRWAALRSIPGMTGLLPVGSRRQRAYRQAWLSERTASSGNS